MNNRDIRLVAELFGVTEDKVRRALAEYNKLPEGKKVLVDESLLLELKTGILEAIYSEDGLDGADGTYLLSGINVALGLPVDDHNLPAPQEQNQDGCSTPPTRPAGAEGERR